MPSPRRAVLRLWQRSWVVEDADPCNKKSLPCGGRLFYFHILMIPNALATELARMMAAKIGQSQRIMKAKILLRRKG